MNEAHIERVKRELSDAGVTWYGLLRAEARHIPLLIHQDEHIMAAMYGRTKEGSAMLVATDRRLLFLDKKPLITISDEISYEVVAGFGMNQENGLTSTGTLFTRMGNYTIRFVNPKSVKRFKRYLEGARLEGTPTPDTNRTTPIANSTSSRQAPSYKLSKDAIKFLKSHELAVLSTLDRTNQLHGSAVYYDFDEKNSLIYILTKSQTQKAHNILATHQIALTIYDETKLQTLQLQGMAEIESDTTTKQRVYTTINRVRDYGNDKHHPPVTKLVDGHFIVFKIIPTKGTYTDFNFRR